MSFRVGCLLESLLSFGCFFDWMFWDIFGVVSIGIYLGMDNRVSFWVFFLGLVLVLVWVGQITIKGIKALYWCLCLLFGFIGSGSGYILAGFGTA